MNPDEDELIGQLLDDVPIRDAGEKCNGRKSTDGRFRGYCRATAGRGTDHVGEGRCKHHGGAADNRGKKNGNYRHGGYSRYLRDDMTEDEHERGSAVYDDLGDPESAQDFGRAAIVDLWTRYERTKDPRYMTELRQVCDTFGLVPEEVIRHHVEGTVDHEHRHELSTQEHAHLDAITGGAEPVDVEAVEDVDD